MNHLGRSFDALDISEHVQTRRLRDAIGVQRNRLQILDRTDLRLGILNCEEIIISVARIDPQIRGDHLVGG